MKYSSSSTNRENSW